MINALEGKKFRFRFGLRTALAVVAICGLYMWYSLGVNAVRERALAMQTNNVKFNWRHRPGLLTPLPLLWSVLGTRYYDFILFPSTHFEPGDIHRLQRLFPEAEVSIYDPVAFEAGYSKAMGEENVSGQNDTKLENLPALLTIPPN